MGGDSRAEDAASRLGLPVDLISDAEGMEGADDGIFPDNAETVSVFTDMLTQWRTGPGGIIGLDYNVLPMVFRLRNVDEDRQGDVLDGLQAMERSAIEVMHEDKGK